MRNKYFDIKRDMAFPFFCQACLVGKPESERSEKDARYCNFCQPVIEAEYAMQGRLTRYKPAKPESIKSLELFVDKDIYPAEEKAKMSTLNSPSLTVDNFRPQGRPKTYKKKILPEGQIRQFHNEGMGPKAIATKLKREQSIAVSYKTIQRILSGER